MSITIRQVDLNHCSDVLKLEIEANQQNFIESIAECLEEARELVLWRPVELYYNEQLVGFAMYGLWHEQNQDRVWLDRYLIDKRYQGQGLGKKILAQLLEHIYAEYQCQEIYLSLYDDNHRAMHLYQKFGFIITGEKDMNQETIMVKKKD
ncbi:GNAT family N-acetyltransferase [Candidatus Stoquefichus massiliensis]|uniref:GNAT family N-acetyltransferase n=1 Tax=Candidatus Stoquefichus massiliensis TaxID=1470350 RepID=UPI00048918B4|nr:GNAT family N-acetyltransferase [Candidatus Stoquefichus massiliensis]